MGAVPAPPGLCQVFCGKGTRTPGHPHGGDMLRKREQDKKYRKDIRRWSEQCGRDNAQSHPGESSPWLGPSSRSQPSTQDEQPRRKIDRKRAFGQSTGGSEVKDTHHGNAPGE